MNSKGSIQDLILIIVILLFAGIVFLFGFKFTTELNDQIQIMPDIPTEALTASTQLTGYYPGVIDNSFLFLTIGLCIVALILASLVRIHPIFIAFFFVVWVIIVFIAGIASNIYQEMAANSNLVTEANQLTFITQILNNLPMIIAIFGILLMVIMYKLRSNAQEAYV